MKCCRTCFPLVHSDIRLALANSNVNTFFIFFTCRQKAYKFKIFFCANISNNLYFIWKNLQEHGSFVLKPPFLYKILWLKVQIYARIIFRLFTLSENKMNDYRFFQHEFKKKPHFSPVHIALIIRCIFVHLLSFCRYYMNKFLQPAAAHRKPCNIFLQKKSADKLRKNKFTAEE